MEQLNYVIKPINKKRRFWPDQILTPDRLKVGLKVTKVYTHLKGYTEDYIIYEIKEDHFTYIRNGSTFECFFADSNLTPYSSGWNQTNYLIIRKEK